MRSRVKEGFAFSLVQIFLRQSGQLLATMALARLLLPRDYGLVAMAASLMTLLSYFSEMGLSWVTIQHHNLSRRDLDNLFWVNTGIGIALWLICLLAAPLIAQFYKEPALMHILAYQGLAFVMTGLAVQPGALLRRELRFKELTWIEVFSLFVGQVLSVAMAFLGTGYWALVAAPLVTALLRMILMFKFSGYRPLTFLAAGANTSMLVKFGGLLTGASVFFYLVRNFDDILIGRVWGATELAYYSRAYFIATLPTQLLGGQLAGVVIPAISSMPADAKNDAASIYRNALNSFAWIVTPISLAAVVSAPELVHVVYGPKWANSAPVLAWLSIGGLIAPLYNSVGWVLVGFKKNAAYLGWSAVSAAVMAVAFGIGVRGGVVTTAIAFTIAMGGVLAVPSLYFAHRIVGIAFAPTARSFATLAIGTAASLLVILLWNTMAPAAKLGSNGRLIANLLIEGVILGPIYLLRKRDETTASALASHR